MTITVFGAFRSDTNLGSSPVTYATAGTTFQISSYSELTFEDGADGTVIQGDNIVNESPNDPTQTYLGNAIIWDYTIIVNDGTNNYEIGIMDFDIDGDGSFDYPTAEQGYFLAFIGSIPPLNTNLTFGSVVDNGASIDVDTVVPCFVSGTEIETPSGMRRIDDLEPGDQVLTLDNGPQTIRWIGSRALQAEDLRLTPKLRPIRIVAGSLGLGLPKRDLCLSPQHRVLVRSPIVERMFGVKETLIAAHKLVGIPGIYVDKEMVPVTYFHMLFDRHEVVFSEGAPTESLYTGPEALKSIGQAALDEVLTLFPELAAPGYIPVPARHIPSKGKHVKTLVGRHVKNHKPLLMCA